MTPATQRAVLFLLAGLCGVLLFLRATRSQGAAQGIEWSKPETTNNAALSAYLVVSSSSLYSLPSSDPAADRQISSLLSEAVAGIAEAKVHLQRRMAQAGEQQARADAAAAEDTNSTTTGSAAPPLARADPTISRTGKKMTEIIAGVGDKCIDHNPNTFPNKLATWSCHQHAKKPTKDADYQMFEFNAAGQLRQVTLGFCVDGEGVSAGQPVGMAKCTADNKPSQRWTLVTSRAATTTPISGYLISSDSGLCLDFPGGKDTFVLAAACNFSCGQLWRLTQVRPGAPIVYLEDGAAPAAGVVGGVLKEQSLAPVSLAPKAQSTLTALRKGAGTRGAVPLGHMVQSKKGGRILCWILTMPKDHSTKAAAVNNTWGRDCDILLFASRVSDPPEASGLAIVEIDVGIKETRNTLWPKSQQMWMHVYTKYRDQADWFIKADDDTYIVFPYLREYLATLDPHAPIHLGRRFKGHTTDNAYYSGGAGIILSHESLKRLGEKAAVDRSVWFGDMEGPEDYLTSKTLRKVGVYTVDTRAKDGSHRFISVGLDMEHHSTRDNYKGFWLWDISRDAIDGMGCCSTQWITTHYIEYSEMYALHMMRLWQCSLSTKVWPYLELPEVSFKPAP